MFEIISDIHLEFLSEKEISQLINKIKIIKKSNILCLLGDIGNPKQNNYYNFISECSKLYEYVLIITGNHEYYFNIHSNIDEYIDDLCLNFSNVYFLNNSSIELNGYLFLGTTLWSKLSSCSNIINLMNDFTNIKYKNYNGKISKFSIGNYNYLHTKAVNWLKEKLNSDTKNIIVLSHHAPITDNSIHPLNYNPDVNEAYCTDLSYLLKFVKVWCYGHTHQEYKNIIDGCLIQSNPVGYCLEKIDNIDEHFLIDI